VITRRISEQEPDNFGECAAGERCFLCGEIVNDPAIMWSGMTATIYLHGPCALEWNVKLAKDIQELNDRASNSSRNQGKA
jgi:hypothetical protein